MKLLQSVLPALALCLTALAAPAQVTTVDRVVAVVNRGAITEGELDARIASVKKNLQGKSVQLPPDDVLRQQVLERMVLDQIQIQYANQIGIRVDDAQLERAISRIAEQNKLSMAEFRGKLEASGMSWKAFREDIRNEITIARLREREIDNKVFVSENEVDDYLKLNAGKAEQEFQLSQIMVSIPENASADQIQARRARIVAARQELADGKAFSAVAASYSDGKEAISGGSLGWRQSGSLPPAMLQLLDKMQVGQVTEIIRSPIGFHMFRLDEKREANHREVVQQTHARHILIKTSELVSESDAHQKLQQLRDRIVAGASFAEVARGFSEDGSAANGGDLGWVNPGETVPEFEQAMNALKPGEVSAVVRSPFGVHLIQVLERRQQDVTEERERFRVRMALKQRKSDEAFDDWLRQARDRAYVNIRLNDD
ncbi:peptidylprolyl isomerase [Chitiniphilus eburneus]|uniref:Chaperone SurA n=1 Tax=Chitiniphilus eburneus TaxID=2571148 RepID=A0A4U0QBZ2_9NEIS|nr:peptidylprolyl isomerase [Chitiniphilus eburneus]TJZ78931.1 molecular chaperone SurA [Chitiniphilus eburneus]